VEWLCIKKLGHAFNNFCLRITRNFKQNIFFKHVHLSNNFIFRFNFISSPAPSRFYFYYTPSMLVKTKRNPWCVKEFVHVVRPLVPFASTLLSLDNVFALQVFHPSSSNLNSFYLDSLMDF
jgi:hypothetical protein